MSLWAVVHSITKEMRHFYLSILTVLCVSIGIDIQAQDIYPVPTDPIAAQIITDSLDQMQDTLGADSLKDNIWRDMPFVAIHQPRYIRILTEGGYVKVTPGKQKRRKIISANPIGYRLEIYQSNDQRQGQIEANRIRAALTGKITVPIYVRFYTPFWRVRIGDFRTLEEANDYKRSFIQRFPAMSRQTYAVRDHKNIWMKPLLK